MDSRRQIDKLLSEGLAQAEARERSAFEFELARTDGTVVILGAGKLGKLCLQLLVSAGIQVVGLGDRSPALQGEKILGFVVESSQAVIKRFGARSLFVAAIWPGVSTEPLATRIETFLTWGCSHCVGFAPVFWRYGAHYLPFGRVELPSEVLKKKSEIYKIWNLFSDDASKEAFFNELNRRIHGRFGKSGCTSDQYFPNDILTLKKNEIVYDLGAYIGDSLAAFLKRSKGLFSAYYAFEPDVYNRFKLEEMVSTLASELHSKITIYPLAVSASSGYVPFASTGECTSGIRRDGSSLSVLSASIDSLSLGLPTFLKVDIEGSEQAAVEGAVRTLKAARPNVAICVYHRADDLYKIALRLNEILPEHRFYLREHGYDGWELVLYAIDQKNQNV